MLERAEARCAALLKTHAARRERLELRRAAAADGTESGARRRAAALLELAELNELRREERRKSIETEQARPFLTATHISYQPIRDGAVPAFPF